MVTLPPASPKTSVDLTPAAFAQHPNPPLLIDVRSGMEYRLGHANQARHLSLHRLLMARVPGLRSWALPQWFRAVPKTDAIAVICLTAHRSPIAAAALTQAGFTTVFNITGGLRAWREAGLPIVKGDAAPTATQRGTHL